jgi:hypothetical protein
MRREGAPGYPVVISSHPCDGDLTDRPCLPGLRTGPGVGAWSETGSLAADHGRGRAPAGLHAGHWAGSDEPRRTT